MTEIELSICGENKVLNVFNVKMARSNGIPIPNGKYPPGTLGRMLGELFKNMMNVYMKQDMLHVETQEFILIFERDEKGNWLACRVSEKHEV